MNPALHYVAPRWLPGGHLQTIWPALYSRRVYGPRPSYRRERWRAPDGDFIDVDFLVDGPASEDTPVPSVGAQMSAAGPPQGAKAPSGLRAAAPDLPAQVGTARRGGDSDAYAACKASAVHAVTSVGATPLLVLFHGLEGSSRSHYAEAFADWAREHGLAYAVPHFRGCSGELNQAPRAYHSGDFEEIDWILQRFHALQAQRGGGPLIAVGISLGGNALLRWAAEMGEAAGRRVSAVAAVCAPIDLTAGGHAIGRGFNRLVYTRMFLQTMKPKALAKLAQHPGLFDRDRLVAASDLYAFDNVFTAPLHGFRNTEDYWARASAKPHLARIRIPALVLNARNDPFVPAWSLPAQAEVGAHVRLWQPAHGGHVGFPRGPLPGHVRSLPDAVGGWLLAALASRSGAATGAGQDAGPASAPPGLQWDGAHP